MNCPKCQSTMHEGFQLDEKDGGGGKSAEWVEGQPQKSFWVGVKVTDRDHREIQVYRCQSCGFLESYAK